MLFKDRIRDRSWTDWYICDVARAEPVAGSQLQAYMPVMRAISGRLFET